MWWLLLGPVIGWLIGSLLDSLLTAAKKPRRVEKQYQDKLILALYGSASSGKTSALKSLFGVEAGAVHPIPGTTTKVQVQTLPQGLSVADTPGLQDNNEEFVARAKEFVDNVDIFIYLINSNGGITEKVRVDLDFLKAIERPLLVVLNKIDTIPLSQRQEFYDHQLEVAGVPRQDMYAVAFDPLPQMSPEPMNLQPVRDWIDRTIRFKGQELLKKKSEAQSYVKPVVSPSKVTKRTRGKSLFVGNLSYSTQEDAIRPLFQRFGCVESVKIIRDKDTGSSRGFGFVNMTHEHEALAAVKNLNGTTLHGRKLKVNEAKPRRTR